MIILSDEIHADITAPNVTHHVLSKYYDKAIVVNSASKSFNLAGLQTAAIIIQNEDLRSRYAQYLVSLGLHTLNVVGPVATTIAYNHAEAW